MGKQVNELDALSEFTDDCVLPTHNGVGLKKGTIGALTEYLGTKFSNPNLLINPDFAINQRGQSSYTVSSSESKYTVDRWRANNLVVQQISGGIKITNNSSTAGTLVQQLETEVTEECTLSCYVESVTGNVVMCCPSSSGNLDKTLKKGLNVLTTQGCSMFGIGLNAGTSIILKWAKLEKGNTVTIFIKPDRIEEVKKCWSYFKYEYNILKGIFDIGDSRYSVYLERTASLDQMRTIPTISMSNGQVTIFTDNIHFDVLCRNIVFNSSYYCPELYIDKNQTDKVTSVRDVMVQTYPFAIIYNAEIY